MVIYYKLEMAQEIDPFVPVKGKMCPYGGWCRICMNNLIDEAGKIPNNIVFSDNFFRDYPGASRGYHGGPNFCKAHQDDKIKYEAEEEESQKRFLESLKERT